jgi:hypothetical protein
VSRTSGLFSLLAVAVGAVVTLVALIDDASALGSTQSLAEVARKEKERRAKLSGQQPAPVISEDELEASRGEAVSLLGRGFEAAVDTGVPNGERDAEGEREPGTTSELSDKEIRDLRQKWTVVWQEQMEEAQKNLESAEYDRDQCRAASRFFFVPMAIDCDDVARRVAEAEHQLSEVRANRYNWELLLPSGESSRR